MKRDSLFKIRRFFPVFFGLLVWGCGDGGHVSAVDARIQPDVVLASTDLPLVAVVDVPRDMSGDVSPDFTKVDAPPTTPDAAVSDDLDLSLSADTRPPRVDSVPDIPITDIGGGERPSTDAGGVDIPWGLDADARAGDARIDAMDGSDLLDTGRSEIAPPDSAVSTVEGHFTQVSTFGGYVCGLRVDGSLACWWYPSTRTNSAVPPPAGKFLQVSVGESAACAIKEDGSLACWEVASVTTVSAKAPSGTFTQVSVWTAACALRTDKSVVCWGDNSTLTTAPIGAFTQVSVGNHIACGLRENGTVSCWADGYFIKPSAVDVMNASPEGSFSAISVGNTPCAIGSDATAVCLVSFTSPPLLRTFDRYINSKESTEGEAKQVFSSVDLCVLRKDGTISCGLDVPAPPGVFSQVACYDRYACAVAIDQSVSCWGEF